MTKKQWISTKRIPLFRTIMILGFLTLAGCTTPSPTPSPSQIIPASTPSFTPRSLPTDAPTETPSPTPTRTPRPTQTPTPTPTPYPTEWSFIAPGIERGFVPYELENFDVLDTAYALRLNPDLVSFKVHYAPDNPRTASEWRSDLGAPIVVNGSFFTGDYRPRGRIMSDGTLFGGPLGYPEDSIGVVGMFTVLDGQAEVFSIGRGEFTPQNMRFDQALECYPMLLLPGGQPGFPVETNNAARRTVIGIDVEGNVIVLVINSGEFTLHELARWLPQTDLNLDIALNLDGGRSTGISVNLGPEQRTINSAVELPIVLEIGPR